MAITAVRQRAKTHCKQGHPFSGDNLYISPVGRRGCRICRQAACDKQATKMPTPDRARQLIAALREGRTIAELTRGSHKVDKTIVKTGTMIMRWGQFNNLKQSSPRISKLIDDLVLKNVTEIKRRTVHRYWHANRPAVGTIHVCGYEVILSATASLPDDLRDDVRSDMFLAAAERRLRASDITARVSEFVTQRRRMFSKYVPVVGGKMLSVDQKVFDDSGMTIGDTATRTLWQEQGAWL